MIQKPGENRSTAAPTEYQRLVRSAYIKSLAMLAAVLLLGTYIGWQIFTAPPGPEIIQLEGMG